MIILYNVFSDKMHKELVRLCRENPLDIKEDPQYGRIVYEFNTPDEINKIVYDLIAPPEDMSISSPSCVTYSLEYGTPNLPPHFDGDDTDIILTYQLDSNTDWPVGIDVQHYVLQDNSAIFFHPNENVHWRTHKEFKEGEYVTVMFFRLNYLHRKQDYSHRRLQLNDPIFNAANEYRDGLVLPPMRENCALHFPPNSSN